jgi:hypothetical protein
MLFGSIAGLLLKTCWLLPAIWIGEYSAGEFKKN